jgi:TRAP transporter 4TM/12TM fusion protein
MTKLGYPKKLAAAVEAVASSGGQIMPPLMGAGAFVMVELTGVPYTQIMMAALLPAILYFLTVWMGINAYAQRYDLQAVPEDQRPDARRVAVTSAFFLVPFSVLLVAMFSLGFTPQYAAVLAIFAGVLALFFDATPRMDLRQGAGRLAEACLAIGQQVAMIAAIIICASIIIGVLGITGLGIKITSVILSGSGGALWPALLLTALACLLLGMEVPTTAAYVICVSVAGPALIELGLEPLQAHLFVFWFALLSTITPPVCGAVFIAAGMIGENWLKVALTAMALGLGLYVIPLAMIANPDLIRVGTQTGGALLAFAVVGAGLSCLSYALIGQAGLARRAALGVAGFTLCFAGVFVT